MEQKIREFYAGVCFDAYEFLGAHPAEPEGWQFCVCAPKARRVQVLGSWNDWGLYSAAELTRCSDGLWRVWVPQARAGQLYKYNVLCADGVWRLRQDPYAYAVESLPGTACVLGELRFAFHDAAWLSLRAPCPDAPLSIYELHAGSWRRHPDGRYYSYGELADVLVGWLPAHGYTHVEFLPLAEHPFDGSWGYQGTGWFAPSARFGTPEQFAALVDRLHDVGIGVLMDFVPVHFAPDDGALAYFDGGPFYEPEFSPESPWGSLYFDLERPEVRSFLLSAASFWLHRCHCDGLRVDATGHALARYTGASKFFQTLTGGLHARFPGVMLVAEDSGGYPCATASTSRGGLGFDYIWNMDWLHRALRVLTAPFETRPALTVSAGCCQTTGEKCINALSHDESSPAVGALLNRMWGSYDEKFAQLRLLFLWQFCRPGKKLNFMGNDLGHFRPFDPYRELDWGLLQYPSHSGLAEYFRVLSLLYRSEPALHCSEYSPGSAHWANSPQGTLAWWRTGGGEALLCCLNLLPTSAVCTVQTGPGLVLRELLCTAGPDIAAAHNRADGWSTLSLPGLCGGLWRLEQT
ncbi:MAG: 1,4-alpha-glucan branching enzyme [Gemmiger sp.]